jgi:NitT/TauT family transport system substrate-binding protein
MIRPTRLLLLILLSHWAAATASAQEGDPQRCVRLTLVDRTEIIDERNIVFHMRGGGVYVNRLDRVCRGLRRQRPFTYSSTNGQLCSSDFINVLENFGAGFTQTNSCPLGGFFPSSVDAIAVLTGEEEPANVIVTDIELDQDQPADIPLASITVAGGYWIELSPVIVAANNFYPVQVSVAEGGVRSITAGDALIATNAETQLLRESVDNPDLRIIMTVTESFYRLVGRRSAGIESLADLEGKRVIVPFSTSANYFLVAMLESVGLSEDDVELVPFPRGPDIRTSMDMMSDAVMNGEADVVAIWEPEAEDAIRDFGDDAIVLQDRSVYREVFNLHTTATALADPEQRRAIVAFVRAIVDATEALETDPAPYWQQVSDVIGYPVADIEASWEENEFPMYIVPDMLDVLEKEEIWVAKERDRVPRSRDELAQFIDYSVLEEAMSSR